MKQEPVHQQCKRCGRCMSVCPVYQATSREEDVARGRLAVLERAEQGEMHRSRRLPEILSRCLLCGACADACVNKVDTTTRFQRGRQSIGAQRKNMSSPQVLLKSLHSGGWPTEVAAKGGALFESLFCQKIPDGCGLHLRFPLSFFTRRSAIPEIAWKPFLKRLGSNRQGRQPRRVALFVGCGANYLFPETAEALLRIMEGFGVAVEIPLDQGCCGLPAYISGDTEKARTLAIKNMEVFDRLNVEAVLTLCASCGAHLEHMGRFFEDDPRFGQRARFWSEKHRDAMTFLVEDLEAHAHLGRLAGQSAHAGAQVVATYHDPCHLRIAQKQTRAPRILLEALPGVILKEAPHEGRCCGHGGAFNLSHFGLSMDICDRRMDDFRRVGPDVIATGCTGCLLQLQEGVMRLGLGGKVNVRHPLILIDQVVNVSRR